MFQATACDCKLQRILTISIGIQTVDQCRGDSGDMKPFGAIENFFPVEVTWPTFTNRGCSPVIHKIGRALVGAGLERGW